MTQTINIFFTMLRTALRDQPLPEGLCTNLSGKQWMDLYHLAVNQSVLAIVYNVVAQLPREQQPPRNLNIQWAINAETVQDRALQQQQLAIDLSMVLSRNGIKPMVLKGLGLSLYYPNPLQRECGDFDCYLFNNYKQGIETAKLYGAVFVHNDYKHTQLLYKRLNVEIHKYFTSFRGGRSKHDLEHDLHAMIDPKQDILPTIYNSNILVPTPTFNICFLIYHTSFHFIFEGIKLRHIIDWALYTSAEQNNIDWLVVYNFCNKYKLLRFTEALSIISSQYLNIDIDSPLSRNSEYSERIVEDILTAQPNVSGKQGWAHRIQFIKNTYNRRWRYKLIDLSFFAETAKKTYYFLFSNDKL